MTAPIDFADTHPPTKMRTRSELARERAAAPLATLPMVNAEVPDRVGRYYSRHRGPMTYSQFAFAWAGLFIGLTLIGLSIFGAWGR